GVFAWYFPKLYREYVNNMRTLEKEHPYLHRNHPESVFAAASVNFGSAAALEHADFGNMANGICPVWCGGSFDPTKGGHIILRQFKLIIECPPGSIVLVPSAALRDGNTAIASGESRVSLTQYSAGRLFRWVRYGYQTWDSLRKKGKARADAEVSRNTRWKKEIEAFSTIDGLHEDRVAADLIV
ncbi:uncharacterized protein PHACADRAFT_98316, partial [Phanerochaete carnosa HHB-10118-sp]